MVEGMLEDGWRMVRGWLKDCCRMLRLVGAWLQDGQDDWMVVGG
jgi:hypothetical protein